MKLLATRIVSSSLVALGFFPVEQAQASSSNNAQLVEVRRNGSQPSTRGSPENFTGSVRIDPLFPARDASRMAGGSVTFEPGRVQRRIPLLYDKAIDYKNPDKDFLS